MRANTAHRLVLLLAILSTLLAGCSESSQPVEAVFTDDEKAIVAVKPAELAGTDDVLRRALELDAYLSDNFDNAHPQRQELLRAADEKELDVALAKQQLATVIASLKKPEAERPQGTLDDARTTLAAREAELQAASAKAAGHTSARAGLEQAWSALIAEVNTRIASANANAPAAYQPAALSRLVLNGSAASDPVQRGRERLANLNEALNQLNNRDGSLSDDDARRIGAEQGLILKGQESIAAIRAKVATLLLEKVNGLWSRWSALDLPEVRNALEAELARYVVIQRPGDLHLQEPYKPVDSAAVTGVIETLREFALRHPGGKIAGALAEYESSQSGLLAKLGKDELGDPEYELTRAVVNDLKAGFPSSLPTALSARKTMVDFYNTRTNLSSPDPMALVFAIFGTVLLFGGLTIAIVRAVKSRSVVSTIHTA